MPTGKGRLGERGAGGLWRGESLETHLEVRKAQPDGGQTSHCRSTWLCPHCTHLCGDGQFQCKRSNFVLLNQNGPAACISICTSQYKGRQGLAGCHERRLPRGAILLFYVCYTNNPAQFSPGKWPDCLSMNLPKYPKTEKKREGDRGRKRKREATRASACQPARIAPAVWLHCWLRP